MRQAKSPPTTPKCLCGYEAAIHEVKNSGRNRGKWYWKCSTSQCDYFRWDWSSGQYTEHPGQAYMLAQPHRRQQRPGFAGRARQTNTEPSDQPQHAKSTVTFGMHSAEEISIRIVNLSTTVLPAMQRVATWREDLDCWIIPATAQAYHTVLRTLPVAAPNLNLEVIPISDSVRKALDEASLTADAADIQETEVEELLADVKCRHPVFWDMLKPFQQEGVRTAVRRKGRLLLADAPGLGKTMQALGTIAAYQQNRPVLIICQPGEQTKWIQHLITHLSVSRKHIRAVLDKKAPAKSNKRKKAPPKPAQRKLAKPSVPQITVFRMPGEPEHSSDDSESDSDSDSHPQVLFASQNHDTSDPENDPDADQPLDFFSEHIFYILPYEVACKVHKQLSDRRFSFIVCDDSHFLQNRTSVRVRQLIPVLQNTDRLLMIWNNPDLQQPMTLFNLLSTLRKDIFPDFRKFGKSYCNAKQQIFGWDYSGSSNQIELKFILDNVIWLRRADQDIAPSERAF